MQTSNNRYAFYGLIILCCVVTYINYWGKDVDEYGYLSEVWDNGIHQVGV